MKKNRWSKTNCDGQANGQEIFDAHSSLMKQPDMSVVCTIKLYRFPFLQKRRKIKEELRRTVLLNIFP